MAAAAFAARSAHASARCSAKARAAAAPAAPARRHRPLPPCRFVSDQRSSTAGSPAPPHRDAPPTTLEEAFSRLAEARLAASEAVERLARLASDPDEAVAELVSRLASSPRILGGADVRQRRSRAASRKGRSRSASASRTTAPWSLPPIVVVEVPDEQKQKHQKQ